MNRLTIVGLMFTILVTLAARPLTAQVSQSALDGTGNHLTIRIDTVSIKPGENDVFVNVYYTFTTTKPHIFRGYNAHFFFDPTKVAIVDLITAGTASKDLGFQEFNPKPPEAAVVTLGDQEIDLSNPILFKIRMSVSAKMTDTTFLRWDYIDIPDYFGVDTPVVLQDGWIVRLKPKTDVALSTPSLEVQSDSTLFVPVTVSDLTNANLKQVRLSFQIDTSILSFIGATANPSSNAEITLIDSKDGAVSIDLGSVPASSSLTGDTVLTLKLKANHRSDTTSTVFTKGKFQPLNSDALIANSTITFGSIVVNGHKDSVVVVGSVNPDANAAVRVDVFPNPAVTQMHIRISGLPTAGTSVEIYDLRGKEIYHAIGTTTDWSPVAELANGVYHMIVKNTRVGYSATREIVLER